MFCRSRLTASPSRHSARAIHQRRSGENGGYMCLDGPTFVATERLDWIPAIRDRDTGIWQPVVLTAAGGVTLGDAQVVNKTALPAIDRADVEITVRWRTHPRRPCQHTQSELDQTDITKTLTVPGKSSVTLTSAEFSQLIVQNPRLWWPNGTASRTLQAQTHVQRGNTGVRQQQVRFGIREITYELSLFDQTWHLRHGIFPHRGSRPSAGRQRDPRSHARDSSPDPPPPDWPPNGARLESWVASLMPGMDKFRRVHPLEDTRPLPISSSRWNGAESRAAAATGAWTIRNASRGAPSSPTSACTMTRISTRFEIGSAETRKCSRSRRPVTDCSSGTTSGRRHKITTSEPKIQRFSSKTPRQPSNASAIIHPSRHVVRAQ